MKVKGIILSKKILLITQNFYPEIGSAGNRLKNIYLMLQRKGYDVRVLTTHPSYPEKDFYHNDKFWDEEELNSEDKRIIRVAVKNKKYAFSFINRLIYYLEIMSRMIIFIFRDKNKYDLIYVTTPPIFVAFSGVIAKHKYKSKMILDIRDLWPDSLKGVGVFKHSLIIWFFKRVEKYIYKKSDHIVINSKGFQNHLMDQKEKITFIPNSARKEELPNNDKKTTEQFTVVFAGNLGLAQDINVFENIIEKLKDHDIKVIIIGYGVNKQKLEKSIAEKNFNMLNSLYQCQEKNAWK